MELWKTDKNRRENFHNADGWNLLHWWPRILFKSGDRIFVILGGKIRLEVFPIYFPPAYTTNWGLVSIHAIRAQKKQMFHLHMTICFNVMNVDFECKEFMPLHI